MAISELLTVRDVAAVMKCSEDAVSRIFAKMPGVIDLGRAETRDRRRYRVLRIPKTVLEKYLTDKAGRTVRIEVPERPERRRRSPNWEDQAIRNLAKAAVQNECQGNKPVFRRIMDRARALSMVPENMWSEIEWFEEEDGYRYEDE